MSAIRLEHDRDTRDNSQTIHQCSGVAKAVVTRDQVRQLMTSLFFTSKAKKFFSHHPQK